MFLTLLLPQKLIMQKALIIGYLRERVVIELMEGVCLLTGNKSEPIQLGFNLP